MNNRFVRGLIFFLAGSGIYFWVSAIIKIVNYIANN
jgi:hypothetical protein